MDSRKFSLTLWWKRKPSVWMNIFDRRIFCLGQLNWADLERSGSQVCLQTHWRMWRGKRRRPQDCSSLRGSSPSSCKFLMELMISACILLTTPSTRTQCGDERRGGRTGSRGKGREDKNTKEGRKGTKTIKHKAGCDTMPSLPPP